MVNGQRTLLGENLQTPTYRHYEHFFGFETDSIYLPDGLPLGNIRYQKVPNTRKTNPLVEATITIARKGIEEDPKYYDSPRARFEGSIVTDGILTIRYSEDFYSTHKAMRETILPRPYQASLFTINGIPYTTDGKIPIAWRNPQTTDQGRTRHIVPAGFIDVKEAGPESMEEATKRLFFEELGFTGSYVMDNLPDTGARELNEELKFPEDSFDPSKMRLIGIVYNERKNFDYEAAILMPMNAKSSEIELAGDEHDELEWVNAENRSELETLLFELAFKPDQSSGHLRGDIALMIGHKFGFPAYEESLSKVVSNLALESV